MIDLALPSRPYSLVADARSPPSGRSSTMALPPCFRCSASFPAMSTGACICCCWLCGMGSMTQMASLISSSVGSGRRACAASAPAWPTDRRDLLGHFKVIFAEPVGDVRKRPASLERRLPGVVSGTPPVRRKKTFGLVVRQRDDRGRDLLLAGESRPDLAALQNVLI